MPDKFINAISIERFRHLENVSFKIGKRLTIISGGNGTGKTSILGLIGHIFTYPKSEKTLFNHSFETQFSEVFRFSEKFDKGGEHKYTLDFSDGTKKSALSRESIEGTKTRFRIDVGERKEGEGKIKRPVIYLGLKRLIPLAQENELSIRIDKEDKLPDEYKELFKNYYNRIFATDLNVKPKHTKSKNKENYSPTTDNYDAFGISAGQDNVGQIILSLLSFRYLKETLSDYSHGVLIVDELDATLYPAAQKNLLELLLRESEDLKLQVIFTTHSTDILNYVFAQSSSHFKHYTEFVFLNNAGGKVEVLQGPHILNQVVADLNHQVVKFMRQKPINVYFEDPEGKLFFRNLVKSKGFNQKVKAQNVSLGAGNYINLLKARFPEFNNSIIILDGDYRKSLPSKYRKNVVFLPGSIRPESLIQDFLQSLPENDSFWETAGGYTKRVFIQNALNLKDERTIMKKWFNAEKQYWGYGCSKLFNRWKLDNGKEVEEFIVEFGMKLNVILDR